MICFKAIYTCITLVIWLFWELPWTWVFALVLTSPQIMVQEEDTQPLTEPIIAPRKEAQVCPHWARAAHYHLQDGVSGGPHGQCWAHQERGHCWSSALWQGQRRCSVVHAIVQVLFSYVITLILLSESKNMARGISKRTLATLVMSSDQAYTNYMV